MRLTAVNSAKSDPVLRNFGNYAAAIAVELCPMSLKSAYSIKSSGPVTVMGQVTRLPAVVENHVPCL